MSVRVTETATLLALGRLDFAALLAGQHPAAFRLKRRLASLFTARLRNQLRHLATSLGGDTAGRRRRTPNRPLAELEECRAARQPLRAPDGDLPRLRPAGALGLPDVRDATCAARPAGRCSPRARRRRAYYLTINGAVEKVLVRGDWRIRVGLAGPGGRSATRA